MKLNIKKYQEGGGMPFTVYQPTVYGTPAPEGKVTASTKDTDSDKSKKGDSVELLPKELITELIKKGIPADVNQFLKELESLENNSSFDGNFDRSKLYALTSKANVIINNSNLMDNAMKEAYTNEGLDELAVTATGQIYTKNERGEVKSLSLAEYSKKRKNLQALTVNELSNYRMYDNNLAFDVSVISTIQNSVGIEKISDQLLKIIGKLGKETINEEGYVDKEELKKQINSLDPSRTPTNAELNSLQEMTKLYYSMGKEGIYKVINSKETQRNHLSDAFGYLWSLMPNKSKNVLKARHVVSGTPSSSPENILQNALTLHTSESTSSELNWTSVMNKDGESSDGSSSEKMYNQSPLEKLINADLDVTDDIELYNADESDYGFRFKGSLISSLPKLDGKPSAAAPLGVALENSVWGAIDKNKIYFGQNKVQFYDLDKIMYDGGFAANIQVPVDSLGNPNFMLLKNYHNALDTIKEENITDPKIMNEVMRNSGAEFITYDMNGKMTAISRQYLKPFILIHGATTSKVTAAENNTMTHQVSSKMRNAFKDGLEVNFKNYNLTLPDGRNVVQAPIFIALSPSATNDAATFSGKGSLIRQNTVAQDKILETKNLQTSTQLLY